MSSASSLTSMAKSGLVEGKNNNGKETELKGWLNKWTNYIKGYQKRWFVLSSGVLSYYRNQAEVGHTCRGSINLQGAFIHAEDTCNFVVSNGGTQTFHLKAANEVERQKWVTALELARVRAIRAAESDEDEEIKLENETIEVEKNDLQNTLRTLQAKLEDLTTCQGLIASHGANLQRSLADIEHLQSNPEAAEKKIRTINERATLFRITTNAMINACSEFVGLAQTQGKKWQRMLQYEHDMRVRLQEQLEQLAKQHSALERAAMKEVKDHGHTGALSVASEDEEIFHDATEDVTVYEEDATAAEDDAKTGQIHRSPSALSGSGHDDADVIGRDAAAEDRSKAAKLMKCEFVTRTDSKPEPAESLAVQVTSNKPSRKRRSGIPQRPNLSVSLWSIMKNCIGKELSKIPMPVNFNEPLSMLQRLAEDFEYAHILDRAAQCTDSCEQMCFVAAFTVSSYSTTTNRTSKPFNPLLGETFECDRMDDLGWKSVAEQVSHHPPAAAMYTEGHDWTCWQEFTMSSKFRGKYLSIIPLGISHLEFNSSKNHYTWRKVTTTVHNIIVGKLWIDNHGEMTIENHKTGDKCHLKYIPYSYFSRETPRKVTGIVTDKSDNVRWVIQGTWDDHIECAKVVGQAGKNPNDKTVFETLPPRTIWKRNPLLSGCENFYYFTRLAIELNEPEPGVAPTDSRMRPDQRLMEAGRWDEANHEKIRIEEKQRATRRKREAEAEQAMMEGRPYKDYEPLWFAKQKDPWTNNLIHMFNGQYWDVKAKQDWSKCPDIY